MARYKHVTTGVVVEADDSLVLGSEWEAEAAPRTRAKSSAKTESDSSK